MGLNSTANWDLWNDRIDSFVEDEHNQMPESIFGRFFDIQPESNIEWQEQGWSGFSPMVPVGEGGDAIEDDPIQGFLTIYQLSELKKSTKFTSTLRETDKHNNIEKMARAFARTPQYSRDLRIMGMFRNAFDSTITFGNGRSSVQCVAMLFEEFWQPLGVSHAHDATPARLIRRGFDGSRRYRDPATSATTSSGAPLTSAATS